MPYKFNDTRRDKFDKARYRVANASEYNESLRKRGDLTVWVSDDVARKWSSPRRKTRDGQARYTDLAIEICPTLRVVFRLPLRQTQGIMRSIVKLMGLDLVVPDQGVADCLVEKFGPEIEIIIPPSKNTVHGANTQRNQHIDAIAEHGRMKWQTKSGYNQRSRVEAQIGRWKQVIGDGLQALSLASQTVETQIASKALNRMTTLGRAAYERVF